MLESERHLTSRLLVSKERFTSKDIRPETVMLAFGETGSGWFGIFLMDCTHNTSYNGLFYLTLT